MPSLHTPANVDLLSRLGSGIRPVGTERAEARLEAGGPDFSAMLRLARTGELSTGLPIELTGDLKLTTEQAERLGAAIDRLAATDAHQALVLLDDLALLADPDARRITGTVNLRSGTPVVGIDAMATAPRSNDSTVQRGSAAHSKNLLRALARTNTSPSGGQD